MTVDHVHTRSRSQAAYMKRCKELKLELLADPLLEGEVAALLLGFRTAAFSS